MAHIARVPGRPLDPWNVASIRDIYFEAGLFTISDRFEVQVATATDHIPKRIDTSVRTLLAPVRTLIRSFASRILIHAESRPMSDDDRGWRRECR